MNVHCRHMSVKLKSKIKNQREIMSLSSEMNAVTIEGEDFCFNNYDVIGFDLDCTIVRYNLNEMTPLIYGLLRKSLVEEKGYPPTMLRQQLQKDFMQRGLILDVSRGNCLKMDSNTTILKASHGTRALTDDEIRAKYGNKKKFSVEGKNFRDALAYGGMLTPELLIPLLDYFDISVSLVFAQAVDALDALALTAVEEYKIWPDILAVLTEMFRRENFNNGKSEYFHTLQCQPSRFLLKTNPTVIEWIKGLRQADKQVFLLTESFVDFVNFTASYCLGEHWRDLFDYVICSAEKRYYFLWSKDYMQVDEMANPISYKLVNFRESLERNRIYTDGNWDQLKVSLAHNSSKPLDELRTVYIGDNVIRDIYVLYQCHKVDKIAICEELDAEKSECNTYEFVDMFSSSFWGSYFVVDGRTTIWTDIVAKHCKLCVPYIDCLAGKPLTYKFSRTS